MFEASVWAICECASMIHFVVICSLTTMGFESLEDFIALQVFVAFAVPNGQSQLNRAKDPRNVLCPTWHCWRHSTQKPRSISGSKSQSTQWYMGANGVVGDSFCAWHRTIQQCFGIGTGFERLNTLLFTRFRVRGVSGSIRSHAGKEKLVSK